MRLLDAHSGFILCAFCGDAVEKVADHLNSAHAKELAIINSNYQTPGNPVSRWIFEVQNLPVPPKLISAAETIPKAQHITAAEPCTSSAALPSTPTSSMAAPDREEAICLDCCKPVENRQRHLFVCHVKRPIFKCPLCIFSSNFDAAKVQAHIAKTHSSVEVPLNVIDQSHLYKEEIAGWEKRCYITGPAVATDDPSTKIEKISSEARSSNGKEIASSCKPLQTDLCAALVPKESMPLQSRQSPSNKEPVKQQENEKQIENAEAQSLSMVTEKVNAPSCKPEIIIERKDGSSPSDIGSAVPTRYPARCQMCTLQSAGDVNEFRRHADLCRANRLFSCEFCPRRFKRQSDSTLHRRVAHEKKQISDSVAASAKRVNHCSSPMVASSKPMETETHGANRMGVSSSIAQAPVKNEAKSKSISNLISSSRAAPTVHEKVIALLKDSLQSVNSTLATRSEDPDRKREHEELTRISTIPLSPPLALRKGRRQCSQRLAATDGFNGLCRHLSESPVDHQPCRSTAAQAKPIEPQVVKAVDVEPFSSAATPSVKKRKAVTGASQDQGQTRKLSKCENTVVKPTIAAVAPFEPMTTRRAGLRPSVDSEESFASSTATELSSFDSTRQLRNSSNRFDCSECVKRFRTRRQAAEHEQLQNCYQHLKRLRALQKKTLSRQLAANCALCNRHVPWKSAAAHIYTHCKPYKCSQCALEYHCNIPAHHFRTVCKGGARCIDLRAELEAELTAVVDSCFGEGNGPPSSSAHRQSRHSAAG